MAFVCISICEFIDIQKLSGQSQFILGTSVDNVHPVAYCDVITFSIDVTNTGSTSNFNGKIEFLNNQWDIIDYSNLPANATLDLDSDPFGTSYINFSFTLNGSTHIQYTYQLIARAYTNNGVQFTRNHMERVANSSSVYSDRYVGAFAHKAIPWPGYSSIRASDLLYDADHGGFLTLIPLTPAPTTDYYACNPDYSQSLYIQDQLIFDLPEYCIYNGQNSGSIIVESGGQIIIEDGANLLIDGQTIGSCHEMWKGFYVEKGGSLTLRNCTIENAQYGIQAERGAIVNAINTVFFNNYIGLYIPPSSEPIDPDYPEDSYVNTKLHNNLFIGDGELLPQYDGQSPLPGTKSFAGIVINDLSSFALEGNVNSFNDGYSNFFENLANGIIANRSSLYVGDVFFKNIESDPEYSISPQGYGILINNGLHTEIIGNTIGIFSGYTSHFNNVNTAIQCSFGSIDVEGMTMVNVNTGIYVNQSKNKGLKISDNSISCTYKGILLDHCVPPRRGDITYNTIFTSGDGDHSSCIEMNDFPIPTRWNVENNYLTLGDGKYAIVNRTGQEISIKNNTINVDFYSEDDAYGIYLEGSKFAQVTCNLLNGDIDPEHHNFHESDGIIFQGANSFDISCNEINNFRRGIKAASDNSGGSLLRGNILGDQWEGLHLGITAVIGNQPANILTDPFPGNIWNGQYYDFAAVHEGTAQITAKSKIYYDKNDNTLFEPYPIDATTKWFYNIPGVSFECVEEEICTEGIGFQGFTSNWDSLDIALVNGNLGYPYFDNPLSWTGRFHVYRRLHDTNASLPTTLTNFLSNQESLNIGKFSNSFDSLYYAIRYEGELEDVYTDYPNNVSRIFKRIDYLDSLLYTGNFREDSLTDLLKERNDSLFYYALEFHQSDSIVKDLLDSKLDNAYNYIDAINPDSSWQEFLQFTLLENVHLAKTDTLLSSTDIYELALNCPDKYCDPIYQARSLIRVDSTMNFYNDDDLCDFLSPRSTNEEKGYTGKLFPNPASDNLIIITNKEIQDIVAYNISSQIIPITYQIRSGEIIINTCQLPTGFYYIQSKNSDKTVDVYKFSIIK